MIFKRQNQRTNESTVQYSTYPVCMYKRGTEDKVADFDDGSLCTKSTVWKR